MRFLKSASLLLVAVGLGSCGLTDHRPASVGTTRGGATGQVAAAIAKVISTQGDLQLRTQPLAGTKQYIPMVNAGRLEFGVANLPQVTFAVEGTSLFEGYPQPNLRMVSTLMPFRVGLVVPDRSDIRTMADLRGRTAPSGFLAAPLFRVVFEGFLATEKLSYRDLSGVPVSSLAQSWELFMQGKVMAVIFTVGTGALKQAEVALGGVRYLSFDPSREALTRLREHVPRSYYVVVEPGPNLTGVQEPSNLMAFDYTLFAGKDTPEELVYKVARTMYTGLDELRATGPLWAPFTREMMSKDVGLEYHPGAIRFYQEVGLWPAR